MPEAEVSQDSCCPSLDEGGWEQLRGGGVVRYGTEGVLANVPPFLYLARGSQLRRYDPRDDTWEPPETAARLPGRIGPGASMVGDGSRYLYVALGDYTTRFCRFNVQASGVRRMASTPGRVGIGGRLAYGDERVYALRGRETYDFWCYEVQWDRWRHLPSLPRSLCPPVGYVSSGLVHCNGMLYACPGHRMVWYDGIAGRWHHFAALGFRPSCDGGMHALDAEANKVYIIQGMGSRSIGVLDLQQRRFAHLRPRLPDVVSVEGERAVVAEVQGVRYLYVYRGHDTDEFWRLRLDALTEVGVSS